MIRIVLVDDQTLLRKGSRGLLDLTEDLRVVAEVADSEEALAVIAEAAPDVVLLDVRMPKRSGINVLRALKAADRLPSTILLTTFDDYVALLEGIRAGARGFLLKDISFEDLTQGIRQVVAGETLIRLAVTERVLRALEHLRPEFEHLSPPDPLTRRELEILRLMASGYSNREIAEALGSSEGTVENHTSSILSKLGVRDRTRAVLKALELGYL